MKVRLRLQPKKIRIQQASASDLYLFIESESGQKSKFGFKLVLTLPENIFLNMLNRQKKSIDRYIFQLANAFR